MVKCAVLGLSVDKCLNAALAEWVDAQHGPLQLLNQYLRAHNGAFPQFPLKLVSLIVDLLSEQLALAF